MTQDEIIEMAKQAGMYGLVEGGLIEEFEVFAKLVAAKEREACAKVCEEIKNKYNNLGDSAERVAVEWCLESIRARGNA